VNLEGGTFTGDPEGYVEKALEKDISIGAPLENRKGAHLPGILRDG
jgi:hypothetical protein